MSICTKTGDSGTTGLMYNRRVSKTHSRVEACGCIDELNAALGLARSAKSDEALNERVRGLQQHLITVMGELATHREDLPRYEKDGYARVTRALVEPLENWIREIEAKGVSFKGWATPGATPQAAAFDFARTICRRAERRVQQLVEQGDVENPQVLIFLNRLSDCLWLLSRECESPTIAGTEKNS